MRALRLAAPVALAVALLGTAAAPRLAASPGDHREAQRLLQEALAGRDVERQVQAVEDLAATDHPEAVAFLARKLMPHEATRLTMAAVEGLRGVRSEKAVEAVIDGARGAEGPEQRLLWARVLAAQPGELSARYLDKYLDDRDWRVRSEAVQGLAALKARPPARLARLLKEEDHRRVRHEMAVYLAAQGEAVPEELLAAEGPVLPARIHASSVLFLVDSSEAMATRVAPPAGTALARPEDAPTRVARVAEDLARAAAGLDREQRLDVWGFHASVRRMEAKGPRRGGRGVDEDVRAFLARWGTDLTRAYSRALGEALECPGLDTIILVTAGGPVRDPAGDGAAVVQAFREAGYMKSVRLHVVGVLPPAPSGGASAEARSGVEGFLRGLAEAGGGSLRLVDLGTATETGPEAPGPEAPAPAPEAEFAVVKKDGRVSREEWLRVRDAFRTAVREVGREPERARRVAREVAGADDLRCVELALDEGLPHEDWRVADAAFEGLCRTTIPDGVDRAVERAMGARAMGERLACIRLLGRLKGPRVVERLSDLCKEKDWRLVSAALEGLELHGDPASAPVVLRVADGDHDRLRLEAARLYTRLTGKRVVGVDPPGPRAGPFDERVWSEDCWFLLDTSEAMRVVAQEDPPAKEGDPPPRRTRLQEVQEAFRQAVGTLDPANRFNVVRFSTRVDAVFGAPSRARTAELERARAFVDGASTDFGRRVLEALERAYADADVDTIYLVSCGTPAAGRLEDPQAVVDAVRRLDRPRHVRLHVTAQLERVVDPAAPAGAREALRSEDEQAAVFLRALAEGTGGTFLRMGAAPAEASPGEATPGPPPAPTPPGGGGADGK